MFSALSGLMADLREQLQEIIDTNYTIEACAWDVCITIDDVLKQIYDWILFLLFIVTPTIVTFQYFFTWADVKHFVVGTGSLCYRFYLQSKYVIGLILTPWRAVLKIAFTIFVYLMSYTMGLWIFKWEKPEKDDVGREQDSGSGIQESDSSV